MVSLQTAENALKTYYLGVVSEQLNTSINPLLARIKQSTSDVWGKEIRKVAPYGLNGGVGAGTETGDLPVSGDNNYAQFVLTLKNLYGTIEISDKAIRASSSNAGAFVNLLNAEMEGLLRASSFNFGRMLYGDGSGIVARITGSDGYDLMVDSVKYLMEGMIIDILEESPYGGVAAVTSAVRIRSIDRSTNTLKLYTPVSGVSEGNSHRSGLLHERDNGFRRDIRQRRLPLRAEKGALQVDDPLHKGKRRRDRRPCHPGRNRQARGRGWKHG